MRSRQACVRQRDSPVRAPPPSLPECRNSTYYYYLRRSIRIDSTRKFVTKTVMAILASDPSDAFSSLMHNPDRGNRGAEGGHAVDRDVRSLQVDYLELLQGVEGFEAGICDRRFAEADPE